MSTPVLFFPAPERRDFILWAASPEVSRCPELLLLEEENEGSGSQVKAAKSQGRPGSSTTKEFTPPPLPPPAAPSAPPGLPPSFRSGQSFFRWPGFLHLWQTLLCTGGIASSTVSVLRSHPHVTS